jgi:hypothetical protein
MKIPMPFPGSNRGHGRRGELITIVHDRMGRETPNDKGLPEEDSIVVSLSV